MRKYSSEIIAHHIREAQGSRTDYTLPGERNYAALITGIICYSLLAAAILAAFLDAI